MRKTFLNVRIFKEVSFSGSNGDLVKAKSIKDNSQEGLLLSFIGLPVSLKTCNQNIEL